MLKYCFIVAVALATSVCSNSTCCEEKERTASYLDIAVDLISKAKLSLPDCQGFKNVKEDDEKNKTLCPEERATDCADWSTRGYNKSGVYQIWPVNRLTNNVSINVYCDMDTDGGGWTVIQRRGQFGNPSDYFNKDWASYKTGFGDNNKEFWIGNDNIFSLTNQKPYSIRFDLQEWNLAKAYANYSEFWIDDEYHSYHIHISGYSGDAGDGMDYHNHCNFSTADHNTNSRGNRNCASEFKGAWWYNDCYQASLNGLNQKGTQGIEWRIWTFAESLMWSEMKIRPRGFVKPKYYYEYVQQSAVTS